MLSPARPMNEQLLLVEDDDAIAGALRLHLEQAGYSLHREADGLRAMVAIDRQRWDLVLLDLMLPGADGWEVCRHLRARHADVPVIMLSARSAEAHRVLGLELGAADYMVKPFSVRELAARIKGHLRTQSDQPMPSLRIGQLELDRYRHRVRLDENEISLTATEFRLLDFLMSRPGLVLTRGQLLDGVWGRADALTERVIDVYVLRLRSKIEPEGATQKFIRSVRGYGYSFEDPERAAVDRAS